MNLSTVLQAIQDSGAGPDVLLRSDWDNGWQAKLADSMTAFAADPKAVTAWLHETMLQTYPLSKYNARMDDGSDAAPEAGPDLAAVLEAAYKNEDQVELRLVAGQVWYVSFNHKLQQADSLGAAAKWVHERTKAPLPRNCA